MRVMTHLLTALLVAVAVAVGVGCPSKPVATKPPDQRRATSPPRRAKPIPMTVKRARAVLLGIRKAIADAKEGQDTDLSKLLGPHLQRLPAPCRTRGRHAVSSFYLADDSDPVKDDDDGRSSGADDDPGDDPENDPEANPYAPPRRALPRPRRAPLKDHHMPGIFITNLAKKEPRCGRAKVHQMCAVTLTRNKGHLKLVASGLSPDGKDKPTGDRFTPRWRRSAAGYSLLLLVRDGDQPCLRDNPHNYDPPTNKTLEVYCYKNGSFEPLHTFTLHASSFTEHGGDSEKGELEWKRLRVSPRVTLDIVVYKKVTLEVQESPGTGQPKKVDKKFTVATYGLNAACTSLVEIPKAKLERLRKLDKKKVLPPATDNDDHS